jgi:hypothetical protein
MEGCMQCVSFNISQYRYVYKMRKLRTLDLFFIPMQFVDLVVLIKKENMGKKHIKCSNVLKGAQA